jgi:hypothetical protein
MSSMDANLYRESQEIRKGDVIDLDNDLYDALLHVGYRKVDAVRVPGDFAVQTIGGGRRIDIFLIENKSFAVRILVSEARRVVEIYSFDVASGQANLPLDFTTISNLIERESKGNIIYHVGVYQGAPSVTLRGGGMNDPVIKKIVKDAGFKWVIRSGRRRIMGWVGALSAIATPQLLMRLRERGYDVKASEKTPMPNST